MLVHECTVAHLPEELLIHLIRDWVGNWKDILSFDSAVCNKGIRPLFLASLQKAMPVQEFVKYNATSATYMKERGLHFSHLKIREKLHAFDDLPFIFPPKVMGLSFCLADDSLLDYVDHIVSRCRNLQQLEIAKLGYQSRGRSEVYFSRITSCGLPSLTSLSLKYMQTLNDSDIYRIVSVAPLLSAISLFNCSCISANGIVALLSAGKSLKVLNTSRIEPMAFDPQLMPSGTDLQPSTLEKVALYDVSLSFNYWNYIIQSHSSTIITLALPHVRVTATDLQHICSTLPHLQEMDLRCCFYISPKAALQSLSRCTRLRSVKLNAIRWESQTRPFVDMEEWASFVRRVPRLTSINFGTVIKLSDSVLKFLCSAYENSLQSLSVVSTPWVSDQGLHCLLHYGRENRSLACDSQKKELCLVVCECPNISTKLLRQLQLFSIWRVVSDVLDFFI